MLGTSLKEYVFIRICIFLLQYSIHLWVIGLAVTFLIAKSTSHPSQPWPPAAVAIPHLFFLSLLVLETIFALTVYLPFKARTWDEAKHPPPLSRSERQQLFHKCLANVPQPEQYLRLWFLGADASEIKLQNVREFFLWAFLDRAEGELDAETEEELEGYLQKTEVMLGRKLEPGRGKASSLRLTIDRVSMRYHSVVWYLIVGAVDLVTHISLAWKGFRYYGTSLRKRLSVFPARPQLWVPRGRLMQSSPSSELSYWYRPHTAKKRAPVVFMHGIGIGLWAYTKFLADIDAEGSDGEDPDGQIGILAVEVLPICMRFTSEPLSRPEFVKQMSTILAHHGWDRFVLVSHSYGSVLTTHMVRCPKLGPKVESLVLIDPVSLMLHMPDIAYNFTRRAPRKANEWQLWYFASMDPGTAHTLGRHFFWRENMAWKEELLRRPPATMPQEDGAAALPIQANGHETERKRKVAVCLAGRDLIVNTYAVMKYLVCEGDLEDMRDEDQAEVNHITLASCGLLPPDDEEDSVASTGRLTKSGVELLFFPDLDHAQVFDNPGDCSRVVKVIERYCSE